MAAIAAVFLLKLTKEVLEWFFNKGPTFTEDGKDRNIYTCKCESILGRKCSSMKNSFSVIAGSGSTNLRTHLESCIPNYVSLYNNRTVNLNLGDIRLYINVDKKTQNIYDWLEWVIDDNLPFKFVAKPLTRKNTNLDPISINTYMKYMDSLAFQCEGNLSYVYMFMLLYICFTCCYIFA